jgi:hypothetical protein
MSMKPARFGSDLYNQCVVFRASTIGMMEAPIRLFEHSKIGRRLPRIAVYALTQLSNANPASQQVRDRFLIVRSACSASAAPSAGFACPDQGANA